MISDFLQDYVQRNIWCAPFQDNQVIVELSRLSFPSGTDKHADIWWDDITLPDQTSKWTIYNFGQNTPWRTSFPDRPMKWVPLAAWGEEAKTLFDFYFATGQRMPTYQAYVLLTPDQGYIIAVRMDQSKYDLINQKLYLRIYRNGFWRSDRSDLYPYTIEYGGGKVLQFSILEEYIQDIAYLRRFPGIVNVYLNGKWVDNISTDTVKIGDYVEYVHDGAVGRIVDFKVSNLRDFFSELDKVKKYLLHPPKEDRQTIRYRDDIDLYVYRKNENGLEGRYYNRHREDSVRMVTHADYSIPVAQIESLTQDPTDKWATVEDLYLRIHIRESGYDRPLVSEYTHLNELYRMTDVEISRALLGVDATLDEWYAPILEQSYYTECMRKWWPPFDYVKLLDMLGYDALTSLLSPSPIPSSNESGILSIRLHPAQRSDATIFEYNSDGLYLGHYYHSTGELYHCRNNDCAFGEVYLGKGDKVLDWIAGNEDVELQSGRMYRFYFCPKSKDKPTHAYQRAVEGVNYIIDNGTVKWIHRNTGYEGLVWSDKRFLINEVKWLSNSGVYKLNINHSETNATPLPIPMEDLILLINGKSAVEGTDYYVQWPEITVVSKDLIYTDKENTFVIVGNGMTKDGVRTPPKDVGFVFQGIASVNDRFDLREGRVMRFVVDGRVKLRDQMYFAEDYPDDTKELLPNGAIYQSSSVYVPIRDITYQELDDLRDKQLAFNQRLEDFLTVRYPQPKIDGPNPILRRHIVYSPMLTQIIYDIQTGTLIPPTVPENVDETQRKVKGYLDWLNVEPSIVGVNPSYVIIVAHPFDDMIEVDGLTYRFLQQIVKMYLKDTIDLNTHFTIKD